MIKELFHSHILYAKRGFPTSFPGLFPLISEGKALGTRLEVSFIRKVTGVYTSLFLDTNELKPPGKYAHNCKVAYLSFI